TDDAMLRYGFAMLRAREVRWRAKEWMPIQDRREPSRSNEASSASQYPRQASSPSRLDQTGLVRISRRLLAEKRFVHSGCRRNHGGDGEALHDPDAGGLAHTAAQ